MRVTVPLLFLAMIAGYVAKPVPSFSPTVIGVYAVLAGDFHIHMFPFDASTLSPWDAVVEARRRGLEVIALTGHNNVWTAKVGRWFSRLTGGPIVLVGEEIISPPYDLIAVGLDHGVDWRGTVAQSVAEIHRQGGVAIAAHPLRSYWPAFDAAGMASLDGAEVLHPTRWLDPSFADELEQFFGRKLLTAIGSSDFHGLSYIGFSRTYVFVREKTEKGVLEALRQHRTVVVDRDGRMFGDASLIDLVNSYGGLPKSGQLPELDAWATLSRCLALAGMLGGVFFGFRACSRAL